MSITPTVLTALLSNPGMGLETFYRTSATDPNNGILPLGAAYTRYTSSSYESSRGDFSFTRMVNDYNAAQARGQDYTFRIMPYEDVEGGPGWLRALGVCRSPGLAGRDCPGPDQPVTVCGRPLLSRTERQACPAR